MRGREAHDQPITKLATTNAAIVAEKPSDGAERLRT